MVNLSSQLIITSYQKLTHKFNKIVLIVILYTQICILFNSSHTQKEVFKTQ